MIALDSSVVVACFGAWHEHHKAALSVLALTTLAAGAELVTLDRRALGVYEWCGASTRLLA